MRIASFSLKLMLPAFSLIIIGGCAHQAMDYSIAAWQNQPVAAVVRSWGNPSEDLRVNGKHLLIWNTSGGKPVLPGEKSTLQRPGVISCVRLLEADRNGNIVAGTWDGNDCPGWFSGWYW